MGHLHILHGVQIEIHAPSDRQLTFPPAQAFAGQMNRTEGGRAGSIHGHTGPLQVQGIGHPIRHRPKGRVGETGQPRPPSIQGQQVIAAPGHSRKNSGGMGAIGIVRIEGIRPITRIFQS